MLARGWLYEYRHFAAQYKLQLHRGRVLQLIKREKIMKTFALVLAAAFFAASFSVHAGNMNAVTNIRKSANPKMNAVTNVMKPQASKRTLKPVK